VSILNSGAATIQWKVYKSFMGGKIDSLQMQLKRIWRSKRHESAPFDQIFAKTGFLLPKYFLDLTLVAAVTNGYKMYLLKYKIFIQCPTFFSSI